MADVVNDSKEKSKNESPTIYRTLVSIIASLAFGYLLTELKLEKLFGNDRSIVYYLQISVSFFAIIFWHEYAMSTVHFKWVLGYFDSFLPFLFGIILYAMIKSISLTNWFYAVSSYTFIGNIAYCFQCIKTHGDADNKRVLDALGEYHLVAILVSFILTGVFFWFRIIIDLCPSSTRLPEIFAGITNIFFLSYIIWGRLIWRRPLQDHKDPEAEASS